MQIYATQGGGYVTFDERAKGYYFIEGPEWWPNAVGNPMPAEWGVQPIATPPLKDRVAMSYVEVGTRFISCTARLEYDEYGYSLHEEGRWSYFFSIIDDLGNLVGVDPWVYQNEDCARWLGPDYANPPEEGEPYKYVLHYPEHH